MEDAVYPTASDDLTLVVDIGKSHAKLLIVDCAGAVVERHGRDNASVPSALGYPALDIAGLGDWMAQAVRGSRYTAQCTRVIASTHGAAVVGLADDGVAWPPMDYEFDGYVHDDAPGQETSGVALAQAYARVRDAFALTLSPDLPAGLNMARQLYWVQHRHPQAWAQTRCLLPYAQYWAWWLSGVAASERSSLGCHTQLWQPQEGAFTPLAVAQGWATLFAPLRCAWEVLGPVRPTLAHAWGLPANCQVHVGVHDSNACLARTLASAQADALPTTRAARGASPAQALTVVSSGTWTVLMAPGAPTAALRADRDMLCNVDVLGRATPTARFMGGREFAHLLDGAAPDAGTPADLQNLLATQTMALPSFARHGGPFMDREGLVMRGTQHLPGGLSQWLSAGERAALAALYCAQVTAWLVRSLWADTALPTRAVVVEGPLAHNALYLSVLQALLPDHICQASTDAMEGTARGAWLLCHWPGAGGLYSTRVHACNAAGLRDYHARWLAQL
jgi:sugar (pentulose or hexulose) kinase